jgi:1,4-alpha-glucan branching enzyme
MIHKTFIQRDHQTLARVTFVLPSSIWADQIALVGDFNGWDSRSHPFGRDREGQWIVSVDLQIGRAYQFRYLCDGRNWMNDSEADAPDGNNNNFVVFTDPNYKSRNGKGELRNVG